MGTMNDETVRQWIEENHGVARTVMLDAVLLPETDRSSITTYGWIEEDETGIAYLRDGRLFRISMQGIKDGPTFDQVVAGLGAPEMIGHGVAMYGGHEVLFLELDYLELGISVEAWREMTAQELSRPYGERAVVLRKDMQVSSVSCYLPHLSLEEVLRDVFFVRPESLSHEMNRRVTWPGFESQVPLAVP